MSTINFTPANILEGAAARNKLITGVNFAARIVGSTLGPIGNNVAVQLGNNSPQITKDGVSVARILITPDYMVNIGIDLAKQASHETDKICGDGTTTTMVLLDLLVEMGMDEINQGANPHVIRRKLEASVQALSETITTNFATSVEDKPELLMAVAETSANGDTGIAAKSVEVAKLVAGVGRCDLNKGYSGSVDCITEYNGCRFPLGLLTAGLITNNNAGQYESEQPNILFFEAGEHPCDGSIELSNFRGGNWVFVLADLGNTDKVFPALIGQGIAFMRAPGFGDDMVHGFNDLRAILTEVASIETLEGKTKPVYSCRELTITNDHTIIVADEDRNDHIAGYVNELRENCNRNDGDFDYNNKKARIASLAGKWVKFTVGGRTTSEIKERYDLYEDAIRSSENAILHGVVRGACCDLVEAAISINDDMMCKLATKMQDRVLRGTPLPTILPYDPAIVPVTALNNAMSVAGGILTTDTIVTDHTQL